MADNHLYYERVTSNKTTALFIGLALLFLVLLVWRVTAGRLDVLAAMFFGLFCLLLFYSVNYRTLVIHLTPQTLKLELWHFHLDGSPGQRAGVSA